MLYVVLNMDGFECFLFENLWSLACRLAFCIDFDSIHVLFLFVAGAIVTILAITH